MNHKHSISLYYVIMLLQGMIFYGPIATLYRQARGVSVFQITIIESISLVILIAMEIPWGFVADKIGYKRALVFCYILFFVSKIVFWQAKGFGMFLAERLLLSVILSGLSGCDSAYLFSITPPEKRQHVFGLSNAMGTGGMVVASVLFSAFLTENDSMCAFLTVITYGIAMVLSFFLADVPVAVAKTNSASASMRTVFCAVFKNPRFFLFLVAAALLAESKQTITVFLSQLQYVRCGISPRFMGYIYIFVTFVGLSAAWAHKLVCRLGEARAVRLLFLGGFASCTLLALFAHPVSSVFGIALLCLCASMLAPISTDIQNRQITIPDRATMLSVFSSTMNLIAVGTNLIFGKLADQSLPLAFGMGALFCLTGFLLFSVWHFLCQRDQKTQNA